MCSTTRMSSRALNPAQMSACVVVGPKRSSSTSASTLQATGKAGSQTLQGDRRLSALTLLRRAGEGGSTGAAIIPEWKERT